MGVKYAPAPRRVLLTGGAGFIGSHVARLLVAGGHDVTAVIAPRTDRTRLRDVDGMTVIEGDLAELDPLVARLGAGRFDVCLHLAWRGWSGTADVAGNVASLRASLALLDAMRRLECPRFVATGTCFEYRLTGDLLSETSALAPHELYGACKKALFDVAHEVAAATDLSVAEPRVFYVYGPHEDGRRLVPSIVRSLLQGQSAPVTPGAQVRDYLHVADVAAAICVIALSDVTGPVNVASGTAVSIADIALRLGDLVGRRDLVRLGALPYRAAEPMHIVGDGSLLRERLGWMPRFDLAAGLADTVDWWRAGVAPAVMNGAR